MKFLIYTSLRMNLQVFFQITIEVQVNILEALNFYVILCGQLVANPSLPARGLALIVALQVNVNITQSFIPVI